MQMYFERISEQRPFTRHILRHLGRLAELVTFPEYYEMREAPSPKFYEMDLEETGVLAVTIIPTECDDGF